MLTKNRYFIIAFIIGLSFTLFGQFVLKQQTDALNQIRFSSSVNERITSFNNTLDDEFEILSTIAAFFKAKENITRFEFSQLAQTILKNHQEIQALEWIPRIEYSQINKLEHKAMLDGIHNFTIRERDKSGQMVAVAKRDEYFPVYYVEPLKGNEKALGFDLGSSNKRLDALKDAANTNKIATTAPIHLVQEKESQMAVLILAPVYNNNPVQFTSNTSATLNIAGYVLMVLRLEDFLDHAVNSLFSDKSIQLSLEDIRTGKYLAGEKWQQKNLKATPFFSEIIINTERSLTGKEIQDTGHGWQLMIRATPQFFSETGNNQTIFLITGILISFLIALIINGQKLQVTTVRRLVKEQTTELIKSESLTSTILRSAVDAIINTKSDGTITSFNPAATALFGYDEDEIIGQNISILIPEPHRSLHDGYIQQYLQTKETKIVGSVRELEGLHKDGSLTPISLSLSKVELYDEITFTGIIHDLTDIKAAQLALESQKFAIDQHSIIATTDVKGSITYVNEKFCEISGYQQDELLGENHRLLNSGNQNKEYWKKMYQAVASGQVWKDEIQNKAKDGELYWVDTTIVPIMDKNNKPCRYISIRTDITHQKQLQENLTSINTQLKELSETDPLTKISNRRVYEEKLHHEIRSTKRIKKPLSLLMIDIDFFKLYNDNYGHDAGDIALFKVAQSLVNSLCRSTDMAARFGGEEFVVLAPFTNEAGAIKVAERIKSNINALAITHDFSQVTNTITVSIGIATTNGHSLNEADLLKQADTALYEAKKTGRNRFVAISSL